MAIYLGGMQIAGGGSGSGGNEHIVLSKSEYEEISSTGMLDDEAVYMISDDVGVETDKYLPLSGGVMTGTISAQTGFFVHRTSNDGALVMRGGVNKITGGSLTLYGQEHDGSSASDGVPHPGSSLLIGISSDNNNITSSYLEIKPNGECIINGNNIVRSVNNITADVSGNVELNSTTLTFTFSNNTVSSFTFYVK